MSFGNSLNVEAPRNLNDFLPAEVRTFGILSKELFPLVFIV